jgi:general secretion pathway protein F
MHPTTGLHRAGCGLKTGRAERLEELGTLLGAGVDTDRALEIVGAGNRRGPVPEHLVEQGMVLPRELPMIERMLEAGRLDRGLRQLGSDLRREARVVGRIKGRLVLPVAIWAIAILIAPLPALFGGDLDLVGYAWAVFRPLLLTAALLWLGFRYWRVLLDGFRELPLLAGRPPALGLRVSFLRALHELLAAGTDAEQALEALARSASGPWRRRLDAARAEIRVGAGLVSALARHGLLHHRHDVPLLSAGETAGRLVQALDHRVRQLCEERDLRIEVVAEWLPRGVYFLVLLHMARGFL